MCRVLITMTMMLGMTQFCDADLIATESFDYDVGDLDGQNGGTGFSDEWIVSSDFTFEVVQSDPPLQYNVPGGGIISGGATALRFGNDDDFVLEDEPDALNRELSNVFDDDDLYLSYLYRYDSGFIEDNDFVVWWFNNSFGPVIGLKGNGGDGSRPEDLMARVGNFFVPPQQQYAPGIDISEDEGTIGVDFFIVGHLSRGDNSDDPDDYDQFELWVNPSFDEADSPHAEAFGLPEDFLTLDLEFLGMRAFSQEPGDSMLFDAFRMGTTWDDVVSPLGDQAADGDYNGDGSLDSADIDLQAAEMKKDPADQDLAKFDHNGDGVINVGDAGSDTSKWGDRLIWIRDLRQTSVGDVNMDGVFDSGDLVQALQGAKYAVDAGNAQMATWVEGDWNGDMVFDSGDLVFAFQDGGYVAAAAPAVPEPSGLGLVLLSVLGLVGVARRR